jgi:hypothetical protein
MPGPFLRRWFAALLLFASPAIGGQVAPLLHPCEALTSEVAGHHGDHGDHGDHGHHTTPASGADTDTNVCTCVGACTTAVADTAIPRATIAAQHSPEPSVAPRVLRNDACLVVYRPLDLLPPPTAPPLA